MSLKQKALKSVFWSGLEQFGNQIITFTTSVILARVLLPKEFGLIAMLSIFIGIGNALVDSGLTQSLIRTKNIDNRDFSTVFYFNIVVSIIVYSIIVLLAPYIADFYDQSQLTQIVRVYSVIFIINALSTVQRAHLAKIMDFKTIMLISTPSLIISGGVGIALALWGYGVWSLVWSAITLSFSTTIQLWYWSPWRPLLLFSKEKFNKHFGFGSRLLISGLLDTLFENSYTIIIGKFFAPSQVGFYTRSNSLRILPVQLISGIITKITFPLFSEIQTDNIRLKNIYKRIMQMVIFVVAPTLIFMAVLAEPIFRFLFTEKWLPAVPYFQILCAVGILHPIHDYNLQILNVKGRSDLFLKLEIFKKILVIITIAVAIQFGIFGLLYGSVVTSVLALFINTYYTGKFINYNAFQQIKDITPTILTALLAGLVIYALDSYLTKESYNDISRILLGSLIGLFSYVSLVWLFKLEALNELKVIIRQKI